MNSHCICFTTMAHCSIVLSIRAGHKEGNKHMSRNQVNGKYQNNEEINEIDSWLLEKINNIFKPLTRLRGQGGYALLGRK